MIITNALLTAGALYAYVQHRRRSPDVQIGADLPDATAAPMAAVKAAQQYAAVSTLSVGLTVTGAIAALPMLTLLSVPLNVYTNLPLFRESFDTLAGRQDKRSSIVLAVFLSGMLVSDHYTTASLLDWVVQRSRLTGARLRQQGHTAVEQLFGDLHTWLEQALGAAPKTVWLIRDEMEIESAFSDIRSGDQLLLHQGDFVPVDGEIVWGEAELFDWSLLRPRTFFTAGDRVTPRMLLLNGELQVRVL